MTDQSQFLQDPLLKLKSIVKCFPGVMALAGIDFDIRAGEVHVLLGENGAGKSTLIKILSGVYTPDSGSLNFNGREGYFYTPGEAQQQGISVIYQEPSLIPSMTVAENICLGNEPTQGGLWAGIDHRRLEQDLMDLFDRLNLALDPDMLVSELNLSEKQMVAIAHALYHSASLVVMDEPTAMLKYNEVAQLFSVIRNLHSQGISILYVTHRLEEAMQIGDRATILRDGRCITTTLINETTQAALASLIIGRAVEEQFVRVHPVPGPELLRVSHLTSDNGIVDVSFTVYAGEILGITGLVGAGGTSILRAIFGADPLASGEVFIGNSPVKINIPQDAIALGIGLLTENRQEQGLVLDMKALENMTLASLEQIGNGLVIDLEAENNITRHYAQRLNIHSADLPRPVQFLSGGTQQKVILSRWLANQCRVLLLDEPTRGVDVGARLEFYGLLNELSRRGMGMIIVSSNLQEVISLADRILVVRQGRLVGEFERAAANPLEILTLASTGGPL